MKSNDSTTLSASIQTDAGCVRKANEDSGRYICPNDAETQSSKGTLTIVADGMGGHSSGEVASQMAVELISRNYYADDERDAPGALRKAVERANTEIFIASMSNRKFFGMGTTVIALVLLNDRAFAAHVGDSRLYRLRDRSLELLTIDHSQVMEMVKQGIISFEEARTHDDKNVILRAVGTQPVVEVEMSDVFAVKPNDQFLLCSDGLCDMLEDAEIRQIWLDAKDVAGACEQMIEAAKRRGGNDNITVGIVRVTPENELSVKKAVRITREYANQV
jgi:serine/threonine protein phosphatase PrpC